MAGEYGTTLELGEVPTSVQAGDAFNVPVSVTVGDDLPQDEYDTTVTVSLYVGGTNNDNIVEQVSQEVPENDILQGSLSYAFDERENYPERVDAFVQVRVDYFGSNEDVVRSDTFSIEILEPDTERDVQTFEGAADVSTASPLADSFTGRTDFEIREIQLEEDAEAVETLFPNYNRTPEGDLDTGGIITFSYTNPSVAIDTSGRFAKHEIIGGSTVRQKVGEDPLNISVSGVCDEDTAAQIDALRDARNGKLFNDRFPGDSVVVQFGSTSTEPISEGGAADLQTGEFLYSYSINCIEVIR